VLGSYPSTSLSWVCEAGILDVCVFASRRRLPLSTEHPEFITESNHREYTSSVSHIVHLAHPLGVRAEWTRGAFSSVVARCLVRRLWLFTAHSFTFREIWRPSISAVL
jgi:hypothetical protein